MFEWVYYCFQSIHEQGEGCKTSKKVHDNDGDTLEVKLCKQRGVYI